MRGVGGALPLGADDFDELLTPLCLPARIAIGASGGGDSTALLVLAADWVRRSGREIAAITVDHGIRPESTSECAFVEALCRSLDVPHYVLTVSEDAPGTGVQEWARVRRYELLSRWSREQGGVPVILAHTLEDQAETVLMRLLRGAGVDGLAAMRADSRRGELRIVRPLLAISGDRLRATLRERGHDWIEDPSNDDARFERVRLRNVMRGLGLDSVALARTAAAMERARSALEAGTGRLLDRSASRGGLGEVVVDLRHFRATEEEYAVRALVRAIRAAGGSRSNRIRRASLNEAARWAMARDAPPTGCTLSGCVLRKSSRDRLLVLREPAMCEPPILLSTGREAVWDRRWRVWFGGAGSVEVGALGRAGAQDLARGEPPWRESPALARASAPAFRRNGKILAVPPAGFWLEGGEATAGAELLAPAF